MKKLDFAVGKKLPLDVLMQPVFLGATRGWGKTSCAKALFEAGHDAGAQCITIAPAGKWWSLRLAANGKDVGIDDVFVIGGPHGDVPLTPESGATIAKLLVEKRLHAVLDVSLLRKGQRARFLADFMEEFWLLKKLENDSYPVVMFIEEAHAVAPQNLRAGQAEEARMLGAVEDIASEGRNNGIGIVFLDQRAARVNKNVLALVEVLIIGRTIHPLDRKACAEWVVEKGADGERGWLGELPSLGSGEAWVYAPVLEIFERLKIRMPRTFNATATAKIGERVVKAGALTQVDVGALRESMAAVIAEAEKNDPRALKRELATLRAELAKKPAVAPAPPAERIEVPAITPDERALLQRVGDQMVGLTLALVEIDKRLGKIPGVPRPLPVAARPPAPPAPKKAVRLPSVDEALAATVFADGALGAGVQKMLDAVASKHPEPVSRKQLAAVSGFSIKGGSFRTYLPRLRTLGLVDYRGADVVLTPAGVERCAAAIAAGPRTHEELLEQWRSKLGAGPRKMLDLLVGCYPGSLTRAELAEQSGFSLEGGSFRTYLPRLRTLGLADYVEGNSVRASEALYPS